jgi:hypothetical protein
MGKEKGYNSSHIYCQAKGWSKKSYENFLNDLEKVFEIVWWRERKWNHIKRVFNVEVFSSSQNIDFPFYLKTFLELFSLFFSILFLPISLSLFSLCSVSWGLGGFWWYLEEKNHFFKNLFSNEMVWTGWVWISAVDTFFRMELCTPIWLSHDQGDGRVVDISVVDAYSGAEVCTPIFLIHKSFSKNLQNSNGHIP